MNNKGNKIRIAGIVRESIVDGPGIRFVVFSQGCPHQCVGCHNEATHDFSKGKDCDIEKLAEEALKSPLLSGITFSGGEPFAQAEGFYCLGRLLKEKNMHLLAYTGYTYEELLEMQQADESVRNLLGILDVLIDGRFVQSERDLTLLFRGSANQRVIDLEETRKQGKLVITEGPGSP